MHFLPDLLDENLIDLQWSPLESLQVPFSEMSITIQKCQHAVELLGHSYHTLALSKEVYKFVFALGAQKFSATIEM